MIENAFVAVWAGEPESVACTVKLEVPTVVGVPLSTPAVLSESPAGSVPEASDQKYGCVPPAAASVWEYASPTVPPARLAVVTTSGAGATVTESPFVAVCVGAPASVASTTKSKVPAVVGVPLSTPAALKPGRQAACPSRPTTSRATSRRSPTACASTPPRRCRPAGSRS